MDLQKNNQKSKVSTKQQADPVSVTKEKPKSNGFVKRNFSGFSDIS